MKVKLIVASLTSLLAVFSFLFFLGKKTSFSLGQENPLTFSFSNKTDSSDVSSEERTQRFYDFIKNPSFAPSPSLEKIAESFSKSFSNSQKSSDSLVDNNSSNPVVSNPPQNNAPPSLSEKEIFNKLWPDYYRDYLSETQNFLLTENVISSADKKEFKTENEIYSFLNVFAGYYRFAAGLTDADFLSLKEKLDNVPNLKAEQRKKIISGDLSFFDFFKNLVNSANAAWVGTPPFCYKDLTPGNPSPGISSPVFCCNCGFHCNIHGCTFIYNCGPGGAACNVQLGCLNSTCRSFPNGIWDSSTSMCGCG